MTIGQTDNIYLCRQTSSGAGLYHSQREGMNSGQVIDIISAKGDAVTVQFNRFQGVIRMRVFAGYKVVTDYYVEGNRCYTWHPDEVSANNHAALLRKQGDTVTVEAVYVGQEG